MVALVLAGVAWVWSAGVALLGLLVIGVRCDEGCGRDGWRGDQHAWQWFAIAFVAFLPIVAASNSVVSIWRRQTIRAAVMYICGLAATFGVVTALTPDWPARFPKTGEALFISAVWVLAPAAAIVLAHGRRKSP